jgi:hypothetical protein
MGFGVVLRDEQGMVIAAYNKTIVGRLDVLKAEAMACPIAIQFCHSLGFTKNYAQRVIAAINLRHTDWSSMGVLVEDIKHELQSLRQ